MPVLPLSACSILLFHSTPPPPRKPLPPKEVRPFNYLNPGFQPTDQHDLEGMRANRIQPVQPSVAGVDVAIAIADVHDIPSSARGRTAMPPPAREFREEMDYFPQDGYAPSRDLQPRGPLPGQVRRHESDRMPNIQMPSSQVSRAYSARVPPRQGQQDFPPRPGYDGPQNARSNEHPPMRENPSEYFQSEVRYHQYRSDFCTVQ